MHGEAAFFHSTYIEHTIYSINKLILNLNMAQSLEETLVLVTADKKLDRDRGLAELNRKVSNANPNEMQAIETSLARFMQDSTAGWETHQGALLAAKLVVANHLSSDPFAAELRVHALHELNNTEARVRLAAGKVVA